MAEGSPLGRFPPSKTKSVFASPGPPARALTVFGRPAPMSSQTRSPLSASMAGGLETTPKPVASPAAPPCLPVCPSPIRLPKNTAKRPKPSASGSALGRSRPRVNCWAEWPQSGIPLLDPRGQWHPGTRYSSASPNSPVNNVASASSAELLARLAATVHGALRLHARAFAEPAACRPAPATTCPRVKLLGPDAGNARPAVRPRSLSDPPRRRSRLQAFGGGRNVATGYLSRAFPPEESLGRVRRAQCPRPRLEGGGEIGLCPRVPSGVDDKGVAAPGGAAGVARRALSLSPKFFRPVNHWTASAAGKPRDRG